MNDVPFRSSFEPIFSACFAAYEPETSASRPPAGARKRPFVTCEVGDDTHRRVRLVDAADRVRRRRDVGLRRVEHLLQGLLRRRELRADPAEARRQALRERAAVGARPRAPPPPPPKPPPPSPPPFRVPLPWPPTRRSGSAACRSTPASSGTGPRSAAAGCAGSGTSGRPSSASRRSSGRRPPDAVRGASSPSVTWATPAIFEIWLAAALPERQLRSRQEEVVHEVLTRLAELRQVRDHRLVRLDEVAVAARRRPGRRTRCSGSAAA